MNPRAVLAGLIVLATIGLVIGTTIERNSRETHPSATRTEVRTHASEEGEASHADEGTSSEPTTHKETTEPGRELRPLGIDIEAAPFVALAALASLALAWLAWRRADSTVLLVVVAGVMVLFAFLDIREVIHQSDENRTGLAVLAAVIAALHLAAALLALALARPSSEASGAASTQPSGGSASS